jgi:hypothetical protein
MKWSSIQRALACTTITQQTAYSKQHYIGVLDAYMDSIDSLMLSKLLIAVYNYVWISIAMCIYVVCRV